MCDREKIMNKWCKKGLDERRSEPSMIDYQTSLLATRLPGWTAAAGSGRREDSEAQKSKETTSELHFSDFLNRISEKKSSHELFVGAPRDSHPEILYLWIFHVRLFATRLDVNGFSISVVLRGFSEDFFPPKNWKSQCFPSRFSSEKDVKGRRKNLINIQNSQNSLHVLPDKHTRKKAKKWKKRSRFVSFCVSRPRRNYMPDFTHETQTISMHFYTFRFSRIHKF